MKAGTFTKFWAVLMTLVVIAVAILAGVWFSNGTLTYNGGGEDEEETVAVTEDGSELESGGAVPMQNMTFKSAKTLATGADAQNEEYASVTLTATVTPSWATQALSWSVAFNDPASEWTTGKTVTDYVTVTPGETTLTATVQCLQPFGEQIIVTVSADEFDDVSATCTVDFQQRILQVLFYNQDYVDGVDISTLEYIDWHTDLQTAETGLNLSYVLSDGTIDAPSKTPSGMSIDIRGNSEAEYSPSEDGINFTISSTGSFRWTGSPMSITLSNFLWIGHYSNNNPFTDYETLNTWIYTHCDEEGYCSFLSLYISEGDVTIPIRFSREYFTATVNIALDETATTI